MAKLEVASLAVNEALPEGERRVAMRSPTRRDARFVAHGGNEFLREGVIVDVSREGLQLQTYTPPTLGTLVEIEIQPRQTGRHTQVTLVRGRVARRTPHGNGLAAVGIRIFMTQGGCSVLAAKRTRSHTIKSLDPGLASNAVAPSADNPTLPVQPQRRPWKRMALAVLTALLLLVFLLALDGSLSPLQANPASNQLSSVRHGPFFSRILLQRPHSAPTVTRASRPNWINLASADTLRRNDSLPARSASLWPTMRGVRNAVIERLPNAFHPQLVVNGATSKRKPIHAADRHHKRIKYFAWRLKPFAGRANATQYAGSSESGPTTNLLPHRKSPATFRVANAPNGYAGHLADAVWPSDAALASAPAFVNAITITAADKRPALHDGLWIDVDKSRFELTVMSRNHSLRRFRVGVGLNNSTPSGDYLIANKLTDPAWYNHGESVPAGDPRNPLGKHWIGLGNARGAPTSYGIHSATARSDIGHPSGRGCIRMMPQDAATLFRLCPIGTPVHIHL